MNVALFFQDDYGERVLRVELAEAEEVRAFAATDLVVGFDPRRTEERARGLVPPIEIVVAAPSATNSFRRVLRRVPRFVSFIPREGGLHHVLVREMVHNRWWGALDILVRGERSSSS